MLYVMDGRHLIPSDIAMTASDTFKVKKVGQWAVVPPIQDKYVGLLSVRIQPVKSRILLTKWLSYARPIVRNDGIITWEV